LYFTSHSEKELIEQLREGRRKEFAHFNWEGEVPDPQSEEVFNNSKLTWKLDAVPGLFNLYQYLIAFRKSRPALQNFRRYNAVRNIHIRNNVLQFERHGNNDVLTVYLNFSREPQNMVNERPDACKVIIDSSGEEWEGPGNLTAGIVQPGEPFQLNPQSAIVFEIVNRTE
jgi:maltooligosyltrehalose trehalohydrolase